MTAFVIVAAGLGTRVGRVGESLHKSLIPLAQRAVLSHLFDLAPRDARLVVCVGHRAGQIRDYVALAHPQLAVEFVDVPDWNGPHGGPGASLLAAREAVGDDDDLIVTSCDTLWGRDQGLWHDSSSWVAVAPIPAGTDPIRWTRVEHNSDRVSTIYDKRHGGSGNEPAWTGLARVAARDLPTFWSGLTSARPAHELQIVSGLDEIRHNLRVKWIDWTDVGDETAYASAVARVSGYDFVKYDQATYVLPTEGRVVKFNADPEVITHRIHRAAHLTTMVPTPIVSGNDATLMAHPYVPGVTAYDAVELHDVELTHRILDWFDATVGSSTAHAPLPGARGTRQSLNEFYVNKTLGRVAQLPARLRASARDAVDAVDWVALLDGAVWGTPHGDFNHGNIIVTPGGELVGIDWRENFAGSYYGDIRYDLGKLLAGTVVHWQRAQWGDFRPWVEGEKHALAIREFVERMPGVDVRDIEIIGALSLLNCAPLHAAPLDEILVARGCAWLQRVL
jgi:hypothetical protein